MDKKKKKVRLPSIWIDVDMNDDVRIFCGNNFLDVSKFVRQSMMEKLIKEKDKIKNPKSEFLQ